MVQNTSDEELERIIGYNEVSVENQTRLLSNLESIKDQPTISEKEYYARAIFDLYNWEQQKISFTRAQKEKLVKKLQEKQVEKIYENLIEAGVSEENIPTLVLNLLTLNRDDTEQVLNEIEQGNITNDILEQFNGQDAEFMELVKPEQLEDYLEFYKVEGTDIKLRDYQQNAIDKVDKIFENHRFASVILPTGAGKSFVAIAELMKMQDQIDKGADEKILYLAPSNEILNQIMKYTEKYVHGEKLGKTREQIFEEIFPNVELATYQSLLQKSEEELQNQKYKFMVLDELHRTGAKEWGDRLNTVLEAQDENVRVLGITATPERDIDGRNMADEIALKFGFTEEEIANRKHIAKKMDLIDAIRLGIVVNPKIVECEYNLKNDTQRWEALLEKINGMEDTPEKEEYIHKYQALRRKINEAQEIPELLRDNIIKKDGKYIFYMPIGANEYNEDDEGNTVSKKSGADKVAQAQQQLQEWLKYIDAEPEFYSMLGEYGNKRNAEQLERFENSNSEHIKIMIVMNKLNEGVHVDGINGIIWQRALDENSRILLLQQLGRAIYSTNEGELVNDEDRPVVIDLPNNLTRVDIEKALNTYTETDDIEMLQNVLDWIDVHEGILPDINSGFKEEARMAGTLKRIQEKYIKYLDDEEFKKIGEDKVTKVDTILEMGNDISLWDLELPDKEKKTSQSNKDVSNEFEFSLSGVLKDFDELVKDVDENDISNWDKNYKFLKDLKEAKGRYYNLSEEEVKKEQEIIREQGRITKSVKLQVKEGEKSISLGKWVSNQKSVLLNKYRGKTLEEIKNDENIDIEEKRRIIALLELGIFSTEEKTQTPEEMWNETYELLKELKEAKGRYYNLSEEEVKKEQEKIREQGRITQSLKLQVKEGEKNISLGMWVATQKQNILKKHRGKTLEEIKNDESIDLEEKRRIIALLELGITSSNEKTPEEIWDEKYELLKGLKEAKGSYYNLSEEEVKKEQEIIREQGRITKSVKLQVKEGEQSISLGSWVSYQKSMLLNKYRGQTSEEIKNDESIDKEEKRRVIALLELGIINAKERTQTPEEIWDEKYELLKGLKEAKGSYYNLNEEEVKREQEKIRKQGGITQSLKIQVSEREKTISLGVWVDTQKQNILKKYRGKTLEEIKNDESIHREEKKRVIALLELGIINAKERTQTSEEIWDETYELLKGLKEAKGSYYNLNEEEVKREQEKIREQGKITESIKLQVKEGEKSISLGKWVSTQKQKILNKYRGKTLEEIKNDGSIDLEEKRRIIALLELGIISTEERTQTPEEMWNKTYELLKGLKEAKGSYYNLNEEEVRKEQEKIKKKGGITSRLKLQVKEGKEPILLGKWVNRQKNLLLNNYRGKTLEEIKNDENIGQEEKIRIIALLELGVQPSKEEIKSQNIGQVTYTASVQECDEASNLIGNLLKEKEKII